MCKGICGAGSKLLVARSILVTLDFLVAEVVG